MIVHSLICGASGSGKSEGVLCDLVEEAEAGESAMILLDPHGPLADEFLLHLATRKMLHRVIYDRLADTDRVPCYDWLVPSTAPKLYDRMTEDDRSTRRFTSFIVRREGKKDTKQSPIIEAGIFNALRLFIHQPKVPPLNWLAGVYTPFSEVAKQLTATCTDQDTKDQFTKLLRFNPQTFDYHTGAADRRFRSLFGLPSFSLRCSGATFDFDEFLKNKGIHILSGDGCDPDVVSVVMSSIIWKAIDFAKRKQNFPVIVTVDEALNFNLIDVQELQALGEVRKFRLRFNILVQALNFASDEIRDTVLQNCSHHRWHKQGSPDAAALAAQDIGKRIIDPLKVHHTEYRTRTADAGYEVVKNKSHSVSKDKRGKVLSKNHTDSTSRIKLTKEVIDAQEKYMSHSDQIDLVQQELMKLSPGWRWDAGDLKPHYEPMMEHPWTSLKSIFPHGFSERSMSKLRQTRLAQAIAEVKSSGAYREPIIIPPPSPPPEPPPAKRKSGMR